MGRVGGRLLSIGCRSSAEMSAVTGQRKCHSMENVTLTQREQARLQVLNSLLAEHMTLDQAATLMGVGTRHTKRILAAYREKGVSAVAHGHRGRRPANATPDAVVAGVVRLARTRYAGTNHTHLSELLSEREGLDIGRTTLRRILVNAGLSSPRRRPPPKHRVHRVHRVHRMPREGVLIQMGGSHHPWLGDRMPPFTLLIAVDDATGTGGRRPLLREGGRPQLLPADPWSFAALRHTHRPLHRPPRGLPAHSGSGLAGTSTQFSRAMDELGIQMIFALSPQAKGRVERAAGTFQDRLVTELRLSGASSIGEANGVLEQFLPRFNRRFRVPPQYPESAFRALDPELCLEQILCFKHHRKVAKDNTVRFQLHTLQLLPGRERPSYAGAAVEVLEGLDGRLSVRHEGRIIAAQEAPPSPVFLRNGHERSAPVPAPPFSAHSLGERWIEALDPLDSKAEDENGLGDDHLRRGHSRQARSHPWAQADVPSEGAMEGDSESPPQGDVASSNRKGVGNPQSHHQEIHGRCGPTNTATLGGPRNAII